MFFSFASSRIFCSRAMACSKSLRAKARKAGVEARLSAILSACRSSIIADSIFASAKASAMLPDCGGGAVGSGGGGGAAGPNNSFGPQPASESKGRRGSSKRPNRRMRSSLAVPWFARFIRHSEMRIINTFSPTRSSRSAVFAKALDRCHQSPPRSGLKRRVAGIGNNGQSRLRPGGRQLKGRLRRADHVVSALHDFRGDMCNPVHPRQEPFRRQEEAVGKVIGLDPGQAERGAVLRKRRHGFGIGQERAADSLIDRPRARRRQMHRRIRIRQAAQVTAEQILAFALGQKIGKGGMRFGEKGGKAVEKPLHFLRPAEK